MALLDGLEAVPWNELSHAYGPATDVPGLLRGLVDPERARPELPAYAAGKSTRERVMWVLWGNVFHQGTVWQATPHVIPFLVEILRDGPRDPDLQAFLVEYLHHLACGYPDDLFPTLIEPPTYFALADAEPEDAEDPHDGAKMAKYARDCYRAVEAALPTIARFTSSADDAVALPAIAALGSFRCEASATALRDAVAVHQGQRRAIALVALAQLDGATTRRLAAPLLEDADRFVAIHAAAAMVLADPVAAPVDAIVVLTRPLEDLTEAPTPLTGSVGKLVSGCLARLPPSHIERVADAIRASLENAKPMTNLASTSTLLHIVFGGQRAPSSARKLTAVQRRCIESIAAHGAFAAGNATFANYTLMLGNWGLPTTSAGLRAWLGAK